MSCALFDQFTLSSPKRVQSRGKPVFEVCPENHQEIEYCPCELRVLSKTKEASSQSQQFDRPPPRPGEVGILHRDGNPSRTDGQRVRHLRPRSTRQSGF